MNYDHEYISMSKMLKKSRALLTEDEQVNPHILGDKDSELSDKTLNTQSDAQKILLDNNVEVKVISDLGELGETIAAEIRSALNDVIEGLQGSIQNVDMLTVNIGDSRLTITMKCTMTDNQPIIFNVNTESKTIQAKYVNFFELTDKNIVLLINMKKGFNDLVMNQLQGIVNNKV